MKSVINEVLMEAYKNGASNAVHFFPTNKVVTRMLEDIKFIEEINTLLLAKPLSESGKKIISEKCSGYFDYYI